MAIRLIVSGRLDFFSRKDWPWVCSFCFSHEADQKQSAFLLSLRITSEFGFTPASRSRIATPSPTEPSLFDLMEDGPPDEEPAA